MQTNTILPDRFEEVTVALTGLLEYMRSKDRNQFFEEQLLRAIGESRVSCSEEYIQYRLVSRLSTLIDNMCTLWGPTDERVLLTRRAFASHLRALNRYFDAEIQDRQEPKESLLSLSVLASDIEAQEDPSRHRDLVAVYSRALKYGFCELVRSWWPTTMRFRVANIYLSLARVLIALDDTGSATFEIKQLIAFNDRAIIDYGTNAGVTRVLVDAHKLMNELAGTLFIAGETEPGLKVLQTERELAIRIIRQTKGEGTVNYGIQLAWQADCAIGFKNTGTGK